MEQQPSQWARRVDEAVAATTQEQLRQLVRDAEVGLERLASAAAEQATLLSGSHQAFVDAQRGLQETMAEVTSTLAADLETGLRQLAQLRAASEEAARQRDELTASVTALSDRLERSIEALRGESSRRAEQIEGWTRSASEELRGTLEVRLDGLSASVEHVAAKGEGLSAALDQVAARTHDLASSIDQSSIQSERVTARVQVIEDAIGELATRIDALAAQSDHQWNAAFDRIEEAARSDEKAAHRIVQQMAAAFARLAEDNDAHAPSLSITLPDA